MTIHEILQKQLEQYYRAVERSEETRYKIRNWCITVVVGLITVIGTGKLVLNQMQLMLLVLIPIIFFWILESVQLMVKMDDQNKATRIEKLMLLHERELPAVDNSLFFVGSMPYTSFKTKLNLLLRSAFLAETLTLFYISLGLFAFVMINVF